MQNFFHADEHNKFSKVNCGGRGGGGGETQYWRLALSAKYLCQEG
jgi:hypothetical protein